jgi:hypothetical protein
MADVVKVVRAELTAALVITVVFVLVIGGLVLTERR